jgi:hypothetical protein
VCDCYRYLNVEAALPLEFIMFAAEKFDVCIDVYNLSSNTERAELHFSADPCWLSQRSTAAAKQLFVTLLKHTQPTAADSSCIRSNHCKILDNCTSQEHTELMRVIADHHEWLLLLLWSTIRR